MDQGRLITFYNNAAEAAGAYQALRKQGYRCVALVSRSADGSVRARDSFT